MAANSISIATHRQMPLTQLSDELLCDIFSKLEFADLQRLLLVSTATQRMADDDQIRKKIFKQDFPAKKQIEAVVIKTLFEKRNIPFVALENLPWKDQYRYAYQLARNLKKDIYMHESVEGYKSAIRCLQDKGRYICSGSSKGTVFIRDLHDPQFYKILKSDQGQFCLSEDCLISTENNSLFIWSAVNGFAQALQSMKCGEGKILRFQLEGDYLFANNFQGTLKIWKRDLERNFTEVFSIEDVRQFHLGKEYLFTVNVDATVCIWKKTDEGTFHSFQIIEDPSASNRNPFSIHYSDGHFISISTDGGIKNWKVDEKGVFVKLQTIKPLGINRVSCCAVKGDVIVLGFANGELRVHKKNKKGCFSQIQFDCRHRQKIEAIRLKQGYLITGCRDGTAIVWEKTKKGKFEKIRCFGKPGKSTVTCVQAGGGSFSVGYANGTIQTWDYTEGLG
jgi:WD40 repeat protein